MPRSLSSTRIVLSLGAALFLLPASAEAQFGDLRDKMEDAAKRAVTNEAASQVDRLLRDAIRCALDDPICPEEAEAAGEEVIYVDDEGEVIVDDEGVPIQDPDEASATAGEPPRPGEGAWANYDFVPGERVLFYEDYANDNVGDFPRRLEFVNGNWEIVEWEGRRLLRNTGPRHAALKLNLPETLPEQFTIEFDAHLPHSNQRMVVTTAAPSPGERWRSVGGNAFQVGVGPGTGVIPTPGSGGVESKNRTNQVSERILPIRIMVDGTYAKVYVGEQRVANVPNAEFRRGEALYFENTYFADHDNPMLIGPIRVAAGGADLYSTLEAEGRATTRGILFAVNSARIRPESTPTLEEIGTMLREHPDLRISIEGHTDSDGQADYNQDLSERRAAAVKAFLVEEYGIEEGRLETAGHGASNPVAANETPEGKQQNRRVELVKLDGSG